MLSGNAECFPEMTAGRNDVTGKHCHICTRLDAVYSKNIWAPKSSRSTSTTANLKRLWRRTSLTPPDTSRVLLYPFSRSPERSLLWSSPASISTESDLSSHLNNEERGTLICRRAVSSEAKKDETNTLWAGEYDESLDDDDGDVAGQKEEHKRSQLGSRSHLQPPPVRRTNGDIYSRSVKHLKQQMSKQGSENPTASKKYDAKARVENLKDITETL